MLMKLVKPCSIVLLAAACAPKVSGQKESELRLPAGVADCVQGLRSTMLGSSPDRARACLYLEGVGCALDTPLNGLCQASGDCALFTHWKVAGDCPATLVHLSPGAAISARLELMREPELSAADSSTAADCPAVASGTCDASSLEADVDRHCFASFAFSFQVEDGGALAVPEDGPIAMSYSVLFSEELADMIGPVDIGDVCASIPQREGIGRTVHATLVLSGEPGARVMSRPVAALQCWKPSGALSLTQNRELAAGRRLVLSAAGDPSMVVTEWSGCNRVTGGECIVNTGVPLEVHANFRFPLARAQVC